MTNALLEALDDRTYSGVHVQKAIAASAATLTRQYMAYGLELFSPQSSQGKSREYCLADVMQLSLAMEFGKTTGRAKRVASILNRIAGFEGALSSKIDDEADKHTSVIVSKNEANEKLRIAARRSVQSLNPLFWQESDRPIFINIWPGIVGFDIIDDGNARMSDGLSINATRHLSFARIALARTVGIA